MNKAPSIIAKGGISWAWETARGDIVLAFRIQLPTTFIDQKTSEAMVADFSHLWTPDSSVYIRQGGGHPIDVVDLEVVGGGEHQFDWPTVLKEIRNELWKLSSLTPASVYFIDWKVASWSKRWMSFRTHEPPDTQRLVEKEWPRSHKTKVLYACTYVEIEIRMNLLRIEDTFDFRV